MHRFRNLPLWGPLAGLALSFAWLLPNANQPWVAFHKDAYIALVFALIGFGAMGRAVYTRQRVPVPALALLLLVLGAAIGIQYALPDSPLFLGEAAVGVLYMGGAALVVVVAATWQQQDAGAPTRTIFLSLALASAMTANVMLAQWLQLPLPDLWFSSIEWGDRVVGNLNQPNNGATLLMWGMVAMFWLRSTRRIGNGVWVLACIPYLWCLVLTGSRINFISLLILLTAGFFTSWRQTAFRDFMRPLLLMAGLFVLMLLLHQYWGVHLQDVNPFERQFAGARMAAYKGLSRAVLEQPWFGYGFDQTIYAQVAANRLGYFMPSLFTWSHNLFLDVAVWFGLPLAALALGLTVWHVLRVVKMRLTPDQLALSLALLVFGLHAMVELPHAYAIFWLPACFMAGVLFAGSTHRAALAPAWSGVAAVVALTASLLVVATDYLKVEKSFYDWRFKIQRVGTYHPMSVPDVLVLDQFRALIRGLRSSDKALDEGELESFARAVYYFPSPYALQHLVQLQVRAGKLDEARLTVRLAGAVLSKPDNIYMSNYWRRLQRADETMRAVEWPTD